MWIIFEFSLLFHWSIHMFLCKYHALLITMDLQCSWISGSMIPPTLFCFLNIIVALWMFVVLHKFLEYFWAVFIFQHILHVLSLVNSIYVGPVFLSIQLACVFWLDHLSHLHLKWLLKICTYCHFILYNHLSLLLLFFFFFSFSFFFFRRPFNTSCNTGLAVMNSFSYFLSSILFIPTSILNDNLGGGKVILVVDLCFSSSLIFHANPFSPKMFMLRNRMFMLRSCHMAAPLQVTYCGSAVAFKIPSLFLTYAILIMVCCGIGLLGSPILALCALPAPVCLFSSPCNRTCTSFFFQISYQFLALSLLLPALWWCKCWYVYFMLSQRLLTLPSFVWILFFLFAVLTGCFLLLYLPNHWCDSLHQLLCCWFPVMYSSFRLVYF